MNILESKKTLNFDLNDALLKKYYPSKCYKKGWTDIKKFLVQNGFNHRQYSGYVSKKTILMADVIHLITTMSLNLKWLQYCVKEFDVTIVGDEYSLKRYISKENSFN